jgi:hypothetical protein
MSEPQDTESSVPVRPEPRRFAHRWRKLTAGGDQTFTAALAVPGGVIVLVEHFDRPTQRPISSSSAFVPYVCLMLSPLQTERIEADPDEGIEECDQPYREIGLVHAEDVRRAEQEGWELLE